MKKIAIICLLIILLFPLTTKARGLVPCGGPGEKVCSACDLLVLFENVLHFALGIAFSIVVIFAVIGGFRWIFSGGKEANIEAGHKTLANALIGLAIILCSWLIINTVFYVMAEVGSSELSEELKSNWWQLECSEPSSANNGGNNGGGNNNGGNGGNGGGQGGGGNIYQYGDACRLRSIPPYDCHKEKNCDYDKGAPRQQMDCPDGWVCCVGKEGIQEGPLPTPPTAQGTGCPNNGPKVQGTCYRYVCRHPCSNPNGPLQCLQESYYTEPMCLKEYKEFICPRHENDTCDWRDPNACQ